MIEPKKLPPEFEQLACRIGEFIQYWGFKRIHGRIWLHLFLSPTALDAGELITRLGVSKALVSMSLADLLKFQVIIESGKSDRGTLLYKANPKVVEVVLNVLREREKKMMGQISAAFEGVKAISASESKRCIDQDRLECLGQMIGEAESVLDGFLGLYQVDFSKWQEFDA